MKLLLAANVFGWRMTGLMGANGAWFIGFSRKPADPAAGRKDTAKSRAGADAVHPERRPLPDNVIQGPWLRNAPRLTRAAVRIRRLQRSRA